ncbi:MAG: sulfite exporter TauE/SafE family protein [Candidatus Kapabacteria bacterium]|nr:sulfite exporter TauE/SafE family protein [Candidatus Kapabacteria bacterium]
MENPLIPVILLFLIGAVGGYLGGLLGVGGALIFVPVLTFYFKSVMGLESEMIVRCVLANSMFCVLFTGLIASYNQIKIKNFYLKAVLYTALPGLASTTALTYFINHTSFYSKEKFALFFIIMLLFMIYRMFQKIDENNTKNVIEIKATNFAIVGFGTGLITSLSGLGGGLIMIPVFSKYIKLHLKQAISISTGVIPFFALPNVVFYLFQDLQYEKALHFGYIFPYVAIPMTLGIIITTRFGINSAKNMTQNKIRTIFLCVIILATVKMIFEVF